MSDEAKAISDDDLDAIWIKTARRFAPKQTGRPCRLAYMRYVLALAAERAAEIVEGMDRDCKRYQIAAEIRRVLGGEDK